MMKERSFLIDSLPNFLTVSAVLIAAIGILLAAAFAGANETRLVKGSASQDFTNPASLVPKPEMVPENVVRIQLEALANKDDPHQNAGIEIAFRFASPSNQRAIGPLKRFIQLVNNPIYKPMLDHQTARFGDSVKEEEKVMLPVYLTTSDGKLVGYLFILSKQKGGPYDRCWMTDAVLRFEALSV